jgi:RNA polymerase sigma factor (sigma-70 family)
MIRRYCICGRAIESYQNICNKCGAAYGYNRLEWPVWLNEWVKLNQKEIDKERKHYELPLDELHVFQKPIKKNAELNNGDPGYWNYEYDEWGNKVNYISQQQYIDIDKTVVSNRRFIEKLKFLNRAKKKPKINYEIGKSHIFDQVEQNLRRIEREKRRVECLKPAFKLQYKLKKINIEKPKRRGKAWYLGPEELTPNQYEIEELLDLSSAINLLPKQYKEILYYYYQGYNQSEMGKLLGIAQKSVSRKINTAFKLLEQM